MKQSDLSRYALSYCVAAAILATSGGSQPPIDAPGAIAKAGRSIKGKPR